MAEGDDNNKAQPEGADSEGGLVVLEEVLEALEVV